MPSNAPPDRLLVSTVKLPDGTYLVRMLRPPRIGWKEVGQAYRASTRAEAMTLAAELAVDNFAGTMNDHATAIAPAHGEWK